MASDEVRGGDERGNEDRDEPWSTVLRDIRESEKRTERLLRHLKAEMQHNQEEALEREAKKVRRERPYVFKKRSHAPKTFQL